ncbi:MAG: NifU family protein, partial [Cyanobacteriota bacterium]|nr:NifU family protein [Cyanobacteriota bacterium]
ELYDIVGDRVLVTLKGACDSCASRNETLKGAIETRLRDLVLPTLVVEAV